MGLAILCAGCWGTALAVTFANNCPKEQIWFWGRSKYTNNLKGLVLPSNLYFTQDLDLIVNKFKDLLIAVPSGNFTELLKQILSKTKQPQEHRFSWATKGMDLSTNRFFSDIIADYLGTNSAMAVLSGPSFAQEVIDLIPTAVELAFNSRDIKFAQDLLLRLQAPHFQICFNNDLIGVQLAGVFKNVIAVAVGICDGLGYGANTRAAIIAKSMQELLAMGSLLNANPLTFTGLAGIGDIILTCCNDQSRNRRLGKLLANGCSVAQAKIEIGQAIESIDSVESMYKMALKYQINMPIVVTTRNILQAKISVSDGITGFFSN